MNQQRIVVLDISAQTEQLINDRLNEGYGIHSITNLNPAFNKLLIIYVEPYA